MHGRKTELNNRELQTVKKSLLLVHLCVKSCWYSVQRSEELDQPYLFQNDSMSFGGWQAQLTTSGYDTSAAAETFRLFLLPALTQLTQLYMTTLDVYSVEGKASAMGKGGKATTIIHQILWIHCMHQPSSAFLQLRIWKATYTFGGWFEIRKKQSIVVIDMMLLHRIIVMVIPLYFCSFQSAILMAYVRL